MKSEIIVKEGEKYVLGCSTHDRQSRVEEEFTAEYDMTEEDLEQEAELFFWNNKEPCWWGHKA